MLVRWLVPVALVVPVGLEQHVYYSISTRSSHNLICQWLAADLFVTFWVRRPMRQTFTRQSLNFFIRRCNFIINLLKYRFPPPKKITHTSVIVLPDVENGGYVFGCDNTAHLLCIWPLGYIAFPDTTLTLFPTVMLLRRHVKSIVISYQSARVCLQFTEKKLQLACLAVSVSAYQGLNVKEM